MNDKAKLYIGVDLGGTTGRVAAFDSLEDPAPRNRSDFAADRTYESDMRSIAEAVAKVSDGAKVEAAGFAMPGLLDSAGETIVGSGRHERWHGKPIKKDLEKLLGCRVVFRNDAHAAALAEAVYGDIPKQDFWFLIWGTGVGGAYVRYTNGEPDVLRSELGHQTIDRNDTFPPDGCLQSGCLESLVSGDKIAERFGKPAAELTEQEWQTVESDLAGGLYNLAVILPVGRIVLGGGVANKQAKRLPAIERKIAARLKVVDTVPTLSVATHGEDAGLVGALASLRKN